MPGQVEAGLLCYVCIGVEGDVGNGVSIAHQEGSAAELAFHRRQRGVAAGVLGGELSFGRLGVRDRQPEPRHRDVWLVAVLLEEQPLQHLGASEPVVGEVAGAVGQIPEDCVGLRQCTPVIENESRYAQGGIEISEELDATGAVDDVDLMPLVWHAELGEQQPHLVTIAGDL